MARGYDENKPVRIWVGSYGLYNSGYLVGDWFSLPMDHDELWAGINEACHVSPTNEEVGCFDYECDINGVFDIMSEYMSINEANALAAAIENMPTYMEDEAFELWIDQSVPNLMELASAVMDADNIPYYSYDDFGDAWMTNEEKYGRTIANALGLTNLLEKYNIESYFDYEAYGRDDFDVVLGDDGYLVPDFNNPDTHYYTDPLKLLEELGYYKKDETEIA